ncbi:MAG: hypothetical protein DMF69_01230 [Acidobacteria bacterium]|nr:MAG: hypothetical protein DMF69_01230 [Acidobacteriota bacterium]
MSNDKWKMNQNFISRILGLLACRTIKLNDEVGEGLCLSTVAQPIVRRAGSKLASHFNSLKSKPSIVRGSNHRPRIEQTC